MARARPSGSFSEKEFYLQEFGGRTLGIAVPDAAAASHPELRRVIDELAAAGSRVVLVAAREAPSDMLGCEDIPLSTTRLPGRVWRALRERPWVAVRAEDSLAAACLAAATRLRLFKVVRLAERNGVEGEDGRRRSFVDLAELERLLAAGDRTALEAALLREVEQLLLAGVPNINICRVDRLGDELFTYSGSGTLFTRERYVVVRRFGIEDYDAADDLIARGVSEGYLAPRVADEIDILLADGFGAFVEGAHLAGIGALRVSACGSAGEVASLYTLTRFAGGGVGSHLVGFAVAEARALGLRYVYACTTFDAVRDFFARQGFALADQDRVPPDKWEGYDPARRERLRCLRLDL